MIVQINAACRGEKESHNNNTLVPEAQGHGRAPRAPTQKCGTRIPHSVESFTDRMFPLLVPSGGSILAFLIGFQVAGFPGVQCKSLVQFQRQNLLIAASSFSPLKSRRHEINEPLRWTNSPITN